MTEGADGEALTITAITPQRRRASRLSVFVNGEFVVGLEAITLAQLGWVVGTHLTPQSLARAQEEIEFRAAMTSAEVLLGYRSRSRKELQGRLGEKGYSPAAVEHVLQHLADGGYINDKEYAARYTESARARSLGKTRISSELRRRGVDAEETEAAINDIDDESERELALEFATRRAARMAHLDPTIRQRRLTGVLQRRGFSYATVRFALQQLAEVDLPGEGDVSDDEDDDP